MFAFYVIFFTLPNQAMVWLGYYYFYYKNKVRFKRLGNQPKVTWNRKVGR